MYRKVRLLLLTLLVGLLMAIVPGSAFAAAKSVASNSSAGSDNLQPGQILYANQSLISRDKLFTLIMQGDGNLVLYRGGYGVLWSSQTPGNPGAFVGMQTDGNLVLWNVNWRVLWASNTGGYYGASASMQTDGNFVIYLKGAALWSTKTGYGVRFCPSNGTPPCRSYWDTLTFKTGTGNSFGCVDLSSNPWGSYTTYLYIYGWSYIDAYGHNYERSYIGGSGGGVGPLIEVGNYPYYSCD